MGCYLYGIAAADDPADLPDSLVGIDDAPVRFLGDGRLRLAISDIDGSLPDLQHADPQDLVDAVRRHDRVLNDLAASTAVLPVRFGTFLTDGTTADALLADPDGRLDAAITDVADADEWVVQVDAWEPDEDEDEDHTDLTPGHAFFARRRSRSHARRDARVRAAEAAAELGTRLASLARQVRQLPPRDPDTVARTAYLIDRDAADQLTMAAGTVVDAHVTIQGPLPAYRFAPETRT